MPIRPTPPPVGIDDHVGHAPAELLGELEAHRLLAFDPVRLFERGRVEHAAARHRARNDLAGVADEPVDQMHVRARHHRFEPVHVRRALRHHDVRLHSGARRVRRPRAARVAVGRHRERGDAELLRARDADRRAARLEARRRQQPFVLDVKVEAVARARARQREQRRHRLAQAHAVRGIAQRQQLRVAP